MKRDKPWSQMHRDAWQALRRVARGEAPGSPESREALMGRGLIEWGSWSGGLQLTDLGRQALAAEKEWQS